MALKNLKEITKSNKLTGSIKSGYKSDDSNSELIIVEPLIKHPEIEGLYRAFDPLTGWKTWVEYTPPVKETPVITPSNNLKFSQKVAELRQKTELVQLGVITEAEAGLNTLKNEVKTLWLSL